MTVSTRLCANCDRPIVESTFATKWRHADGFFSCVEGYLAGGPIKDADGRILKATPKEGEC